MYIKNYVKELFGGFIDFINIVNFIKNEETVVLVGGTASGKDTLLKKVLSLTSPQKALISHTTRPMRDGEVNGVEYWFISDEEFSEISFIENREYKVAHDKNIWKYGLSVSEGRRSGILILDWQGAQDFKAWRESNGLKAPIIVFVDVSKPISKERQMKRGDYNKEEFDRRWEADMKWIAAAAKEADYWTIG